MKKPLEIAHRTAAPHGLHRHMLLHMHRCRAGHRGHQQKLSGGAGDGRRGHHHGLSAGMVPRLSGGASIIWHRMVKVNDG